MGRFFWRDTDGSWKSNNLGPGIQALRKHVTEFVERVEKLDDECQSAVTADDYFHILQEVTPLFRTIRNLHAALQEAREKVPEDRELISVRDLAATAERAAELLAISRSRFDELKALGRIPAAERWVAGKQVCSRLTIERLKEDFDRGALSFDLTELDSSALSKVRQRRRNEDAQPTR